MNAKNGRAQLNHAQIAKLEAETQSIWLDVKLREEGVKSARLEREMLELTRDRALVDERVWHAQSLFTREYRFSGPISYATREFRDTVTPCIETLTAWARFSPREPIKIILDTPGGDAFAGMTLYGFLDGLKNRGHALTIEGQGLVASMGSILLQVASHRLLGRESMMLIHEVGGSGHGSYGDLQDTMTLLTKLQDRVITIFLAKSKLDRATFVSRWARKDWWLTAAEALEAGFIDEVV